MTPTSPIKTERSWNGCEQVLAEIDETHRVYLCEYGLIHLVWGENVLPYCPGDFMGLPFMLHNLVAECDVRCLQSEPCDEARNTGATVYLKYGTLRFPLAPWECCALHKIVQAAVKRVIELRRAGYLADLLWYPPEVGDEAGASTAGGC